MFTNADKLRCAERELVQRRRVYSRLIADGRMTKRQADREIELMAAIADDYQNKVDNEKPPSLLQAG